jgi:hypothetical protein
MKPFAWYADREGHGWIRVFGYGVCWKPLNAPALFSEREGFTRYRRFRGSRWTWLKPWSGNHGAVKH